MKKALSFNDVLLVPGYSSIASRKDVDLSVEFMGEKLTLPILSAPMDSVTNDKLAIELHRAGGLATLHRFQSIGDNIREFEEIVEVTGKRPIVSVGLNDEKRLDDLVRNGANKVLLDVAHGGMSANAEWASSVATKYPNLHVMIGNFSTAAQIHAILSHMKNKPASLSWRMGVGGGSACTTRIKTGCGMPTLASIIDSQGYHGTWEPNIVGDGGFKTPGDIAKGLAAGANVVMLGSMLAGTTESPGEKLLRHIQTTPSGLQEFEVFKKYRGSAAASSYKDQGKDWACAEGEEFTIPYKGSVKNVLAEIEGGLRSALAYVGAKNLTEFRDYATFVEITNNGWEESKAHGKKG